MKRNCFLSALVLFISIVPIAMKAQGFIVDSSYSTLAEALDVRTLSDLEEGEEVRFLPMLCIQNDRLYAWGGRFPAESSTWANRVQMLPDQQIDILLGPVSQPPNPDNIAVAAERFLLEVLSCDFIRGARGFQNETLFEVRTFLGFSSLSDLIEEVR